MSKVVVSFSAFTGSIFGLRFSDILFVPVEYYIWLAVAELFVLNSWAYRMMEEGTKKNCQNPQKAS